MAAVVRPEDEKEAAAVRQALEAEAVHLQAGLGDKCDPEVKL